MKHREPKQVKATIIRTSLSYYDLKLKASFDAGE